MPFIDPSTLDIHSKNYRQLAQVPSEDAAHGGEDVPVYATGIQQKFLAFMAVIH